MSGRLLAILLLAFLAAGAWPGDGSAQSPRQRPSRPTIERPPAQKDPKNVKLSRGLRDAQNLMRRGKYSEALARLDTIEQEGRGVEGYLLLRGTCLRRLGRYGEAIDLYRAEADRLVRENGNPREMLIELERALREGKDPEGAFAVCLELHRRGGGTARWVRDEMESLIQADRLGERALPPLRAEIERRPAADDLRDLFVGALFFLGRYEESLAEAAQLDRARNANGRVLLDHLRMISKKKVPEAALAVADSAMAEGLEDEDLQEATLLRAHALRKLRRFGEAVEAYEQAAVIAKHAPLSRVAQRERADVLVRDLRSFEEGERAYEELVASIEKAPRRERGTLLSQALVALADCRLRMGRYEAAKDALQQVEEREVNPVGKEEAVFQQAEILFYAGSTEGAKAGYQRVVEEFTGGNRVNDALERLLLLTRAADAGALPMAALGQIAYQWRVGSPQRVLEIAAEGGRFCGDCPAAEDFLREESMALLDLNRIEEAADSADSLADRFPESGAAPGVLRAVADRMRQIHGETDDVLNRYEDLVIRFPESHEALEVRSLLRDLREDSREREDSPGEVG